MEKRIETESTFQAKLRKLRPNLINRGVDNQEAFLFVGQFCSSPYIARFTGEEVMKEYVFLIILLIVLSGQQGSCGLDP